MTWPSGYWNIFKVSDEIVDELNNLLDNVTEYDESNLTINGKQSFNVLDKIDIGKIEIPMALAIESNSRDILDRPFETFHVHLIKYEMNGYQLPHDHSSTEDFSFIVYLNDSDQQTAFYRNEYMYVKPERGKAIAFDSNLLHWSLPGKIGKRIAVGAVKYINGY